MSKIDGVSGNVVSCPVECPESEKNKNPKANTDKTLTSGINRAGQLSLLSLLGTLGPLAQSAVLIKNHAASGKFSVSPEAEKPTDAELSFDFSAGLEEERTAGEVPSISTQSGMDTIRRFDISWGSKEKIREPAGREYAENVRMEMENIRCYNPDKKSNNVFSKVSPHQAHAFLMLLNKGKASEIHEDIVRYLLNSLVALEMYKVVKFPKEKESGINVVMPELENLLETHHGLREVTSDIVSTSALRILNSWIKKNEKSIRPDEVAKSSEVGKILALITSTRTRHPIRLDRTM